MSTPQEQFQQAVAHHRAGRLKEAERIYARLLARHPDHPETLFMYGTLRAQAGDLDAAERHLSRAVKVRPDYLPAHLGLARIQLDRGRPDDAVAALEGVAGRFGGDARFLNQLGIALRAQGRPDAAADRFREAVRRDPGLAEAHGYLGQLLQADGDLAGALACFRRCVDADPANPAGNVWLAALQRAQGDPDAAVATLRAALERAPGNPDLEYHLADALMAVGQPFAAAAPLERALAARPDWAMAHFLLGGVRLEEGAYEKAEPHFERVVALQPDRPEGHFGLGRVCVKRYRIEEAARHLRRALDLASDSSQAPVALSTEILIALSEVLARLGDHAGSNEAALRAAELQPDNLYAISGYLFGLCYDPEATPEEIGNAHREWMDRYTGRLGIAPGPHSNDRDPERPLRVGYVSPDFRGHAVSAFFEPLLAAHDPKVVSAICYANVALPDAVTKRLQGLAHSWRDVRGQPAAAVAERIRSDRIDILVDLAGHSVFHLLEVFAHRPAPVQVTYLGYPATTGLAAIDYRITDPWTDPEGTDQWCTEKLLRLPGGFCCYLPPMGAPGVGPLPASADGHVTFGSLMNSRKINDRVIALWARVLQAVPDSRLVLRRSDFVASEVRERLLAAFEAHGVSRDRVDCEGHKLRQVAEVAALYNGFDISLDTFPYNGHTTTCESLWMGVPVVALEGASYISRVGVSVLSTTGLADWIARDEDAYVAIAADLAGDLDRLAETRASLRDRLKGSPLLDGERLRREVEGAYRDIWRRWCAGPAD